MRRCHATNPLSWSVMKKGKFTITFIASGLIEERLRSVQRANPLSNSKLLNASKNQKSLNLFRPTFMRCVFSFHNPSSHAAQMKYTTWRYEMPPTVRSLFSIGRRIAGPQLISRTRPLLQAVRRGMALHKVTIVAIETRVQGH